LSSIQILKSSRNSRKGNKNASIKRIGRRKQG
jgi:hypothetical protein